jgi:hypothetical protein
MKHFLFAAMFLLIEFGSVAAFASHVGTGGPM